MQSLTNSTTRALDALDIKICLTHGDDLAIKRIPARINSMADLSAIARTLCDKNGVSTECDFKITYQTEHDEAIDVEDDADLQVAYAIALSGSKQLRFNIALTNEVVKPKQAATPMEVQTEPVAQIDDKDLLDDVKARKGKFGAKKNNGVPRKALKSLI
jgi:hypothetical protein